MPSQTPSQAPGADGPDSGFVVCCGKLLAPDPVVPTSVVGAWAPTSAACGEGVGRGVGGGNGSNVM
ncbi:MAG: hypothetical protein IPM54_12940 [Polyangiaceae bacterium]|nr:hypothetical protein [Polyangiaceae bacterium]